MKKFWTFMREPRLSYIDFIVVLFISDVVIPIIIDIFK